MKNSYWLILLFLVWCIVAALWYLLGVKEISTEPTHFNAGSNLKAILEIIAMILVSFLLGFFLSWLLRGETLEAVTNNWLNAQYQLDNNEKEVNTLKGKP